MHPLTSFLTITLGLLTALCEAVPYHPHTLKRQDGRRLVFAHFMMGIVGTRTSSTDYDLDMKTANASGIDAFALNIGTDAHNIDQLNHAYDSAAANNMSVFISFDFHYFSPSDAAGVGNLIKQFGSKPAQLKVGDKVFVSSFLGDGLDVNAVREAAGMDLYFAPNFDPHLTPSSSAIDGAFNWMAWPHNGANRAPDAANNISVSSGDISYKSFLETETTGRGYIAPVSPWFFTHYGPEVSYPKNWVFPADLLWYYRWKEILELSPRFVEIISWNDYGESHYVGPLASKHSDDGNSKWVSGMPHGGFLEMARPFIRAFKEGRKDVEAFMKEEKVVYWFKPMGKGIECGGTDAVGVRPEGYETLEDSVFVVALLKEAGQVVVESGGNKKTFDAPKGASEWRVDLGVGKQTFKVVRGGAEVMSGTSERDVVDTCPCGLYNYNAFVGTVPAGPSDALDAEGMTNINNGKVTCDGA